MSSLPAPLRDLVVGFCIVGIVLAVVRLLDPGGAGPETWVLLPVGAGLFVMRQGVRRMVLRQVEGRPEQRDAGSGESVPAEEGVPADHGPAAALPRAPRSWPEDPVRVIGLGLLLVAALVVLAFW